MSVLAFMIASWVVITDQIQRVTIVKPPLFQKADRQL